MHDFIVAEIFCTIVCILCNRDYLVVQKYVIHGTIKLVEGMQHCAQLVYNTLCSEGYMAAGGDSSKLTQSSFFVRQATISNAGRDLLLCVTIAHCFTLSQLHIATVSLSAIAHCTKYNCTLFLHSVTLSTIEPQIAKEIPCKYFTQDACNSVMKRLKNLR